LQEVEQDNSVYYGEDFVAVVNTVTAGDGTKSYDVVQWGNIDAVPHPVPFFIGNWNFAQFDQAVDFVKALQAK
jgi:hypothetical protein